MCSAAGSVEAFKELRAPRAEEAEDAYDLAAL
jgi:hypothetical protein